MINNKKFTVIVLLVALMILAACGGGADEASMAFANEPAADRDFEFAAEAEEAAFSRTQANSDPGADSPLTPTGERLIIRTGHLSIVVQDTEASMAEITQMIETNGGWVVNSNVFQYSGDAKTGEITVRIPAEGFNSAISAIKAMALEVTSESTSGQDVTDEYVDLSSRLGNLEATADRVRNFLDASKNVEEALAVNQELSRLEGEIEVIKGRLQYLSQSATFSTLTINLTPDVLSQPIEVGGWRPQGIALEAIRTLLDTLQGLATVLIWLVIYVLPLVLLLGIPAWLFIRFIVRRRRQRRAAAPAE